MKRNAKGLGALPRFAMRKALHHPTTIAGILLVLAVLFLVYFLPSNFASDVFSDHPYSDFDTAAYREVTKEQVETWQKEVYATYGGVLTNEKYNALIDFINAYEAEDQQLREKQGDTVSFELLHTPEEWTKYRTANELENTYGNLQARQTRIAQLQNDTSPAGKLERSLLERIPAVSYAPLATADNNFFILLTFSFLLSGVVILALCDTFAKERRTRMEEMALCTLRGRTKTWYATILGAGLLCIVLLAAFFLLCFLPMAFGGLHLSTTLYQDYRPHSPYPMTELGAVGASFALILLGLWCTAAITLACAAFLPGSVLPMLVSGAICLGPFLLYILTNSDSPIFFYTLAGLLIPEFSLRDFYAVTIGPVAIPQPIVTVVLWAVVSAILLILTQNHLRRRFARGIQ